MCADCWEMSGNVECAECGGMWLKSANFAGNVDDLDFANGVLDWIKHTNKKSNTSRE
jgi:hypothetical protein